MVETVLRNKIRRLRFDHGEMTQKELAQRVGCTRQTIHAIEAAKYAPSLELAFRIARVFEMGVEDVFLYDTEIEGEARGHE
ncbi:MAG: helix-turn-helix domain-containing protein [Anaerolineales bacterium]|nr:helix-turn-helix domain-containing protein [Anaerolineales bacterium]